jgi:hypothetical protein
MAGGVPRATSGVATGQLAGLAALPPSARDGAFCGRGRARQSRRSCCGRHFAHGSLALACPAPLVFGCISIRIDGYHDAHDAVLLQTGGSLTRAQASEMKQFDSSTGEPNLSFRSRRGGTPFQRCMGISRRCRALFDVIEPHPVAIGNVARRARRHRV